ncbi:hypothetical protein RN001_001945 [Aquatica leii]|uniref:Uncharacterized protein n=1 Tax=Aquatica leii TaxID=1421715 RepID=A0AAN7SLK4_9COLE|nr:hypothetical protein RN001_001945 [Aquatica leii]
MPVIRTELKRVFIMQVVAPVLCALATFVLLTERLRIVTAIENTNNLKTKRDQSKYTTQYDNFDVDRLLASERLMKSYIKCLQDKGPCTKEGRELKTFLPDALMTDCEKCSDIQKQQGGKVLSHILQFYREDWEELVQLYDPDGIFREKYGYEQDDDDDGDEARRK